MATTNYTDADFKVGSIQSRTDAAGADYGFDVDGEELRLYADLFTGGILQAGFLEVAAGAGLSVDVGSGTPKTDVAVLDGAASGQGNYLARQELGTVNLALGAADLSLDRIDEVYIVVEDDPYDSSGRALCRYAVRQGDDSATPVAPGPDAGWKASLLLATLDIAAAATSLAGGDITDERTTVGINFDLDPADIGAADATDFAAHEAAVNPHGLDADDINVYEKTATYSDTEVDALLAVKSPTSHDHDADYQELGHDHGRYYYAGATAAQQKITASTSAPSGGNNGDIWLQY